MADPERRGARRLEDQDMPPPSGRVPGGKNVRVRWAEHREQVRSANRARYRAQQRLIAEKRERFDELYAEEAQRVGVVPKPYRTEAEKVADEIERLKQLLRDAGYGDG